MTITIQNADDYINLNVIDIEDWSTSDEARKQRLLNVASQVLTTRFKTTLSTIPTFVLPDEAVYEFANTLGILFNDENKHMLNGVQQLSATGVASFMYKPDEVRGVAKYNLADYIPQRAYDLINALNSTNFTRGKTVKWTVI